jgi:hypothetical protein
VQQKKMRKVAVKLMTTEAMTKRSDNSIGAFLGSSS